MGPQMAPEGPETAHEGCMSAHEGLLGACSTMELWNAPRNAPQNGSCSEVSRRGDVHWWHLAT